MKSAIGVTAALLLTLSAAAGAGQPVLNKRVIVAPLKVKPVDPEAARLGQALKDKNVSFDFVQTPLRDVVAFTRQLLDINVILDPAVDGGKTLTLKVNDMPAGKALSWIARVSGGEMKIEDGAVYIAAAPKPKAKVGYQAYPYRRSVGRAQIQLGDAATVDLQLYDDDLDPDTRKMLLKLLHQALERELAKLEKKAK